MANNADNLDQASDIEMDFREKAIKAASYTVPTPKDFDGLNCIDCTLEIPKLRLNLGKFRCVDCQTLFERGSKLYRRY